MTKEIIPMERIARSIYLFRGQKVLLDFDLASLYGVATKVLNQAVKRNAARLPQDFMFRLSEEEAATLQNWSQFVTSSHKHRGETYQTNRELAQKFAELEQRVGKHDEEIAAIIEAIRQLMTPPEKPRRETGFHVREKTARYRARNGR